MSTTISRRSLIGATAVVAAARASGHATPAHAQSESKESDKITHADAQYQLAPKGQQRCEICLQFDPPDHCKIVQSPITPKGWCQYFAARDNAQ
jgi:hypothetical protein